MTGREQIDTSKQEQIKHIGQYGIGNIWCIIERDLNSVFGYREEGIVVVGLMTTVEVLKEFMDGLPSKLREPSFGCLLYYDGDIFVKFPSRDLRVFSLSNERRLRLGRAQRDLLIQQRYLADQRDMMRCCRLVVACVVVVISICGWWFFR
ncbi:hypothetical protein TWF696_007375 [Orbilia brochopaga]|uniref:Uncharacterized protein n=1 Tax=Orbilia brochopaga TaxID=3140254 RepID=A0AAV9UT84_9PEZI